MSTNFADLIAARFGDVPDLPETPPMDPMIARVLGRRVHREYADSPVSDALIDLLLAVAFSAPSKSDYQQASVIKVDDAAKRAAIAAAVPDMPWIAAAPRFLIFLGDSRRLDRICSLHGTERANGGLEGLFNATVDAALVMQTFLLAAESAGLGCCPISYVRYHMDTVARELALPDGVFPVAGLCVGYPVGEGRVSPRLPFAATVHRDVYDDGAFERHIESYDKRRAETRPIAPEKQRNPNRFGRVACYGWSEDKARQAAEADGTSFPTWLRGHGFPGT